MNRYKVKVSERWRTQIAEAKQAQITMETKHHRLQNESGIEKQIQRMNDEKSYLEDLYLTATRTQPNQISGVTYMP